MLKLTSCKGGNVVYIRADHVSIIERSNVDNSTMVGANGLLVNVKETAEEIFAMPEMVYAMHPAMVVNQPQTNVTVGDFTADAMKILRTNWPGLVILCGCIAFWAWAAW